MESMIDTFLLFLENIGLMIQNSISSFFQFFSVVRGAFTLPGIIVQFLPSIIGVCILMITSFAVVRALL